MLIENKVVDHIKKASLSENKVVPEGEDDNDCAAAGNMPISPRNDSDGEVVLRLADVIAEKMRKRLAEKKQKKSKK